MEGELEEGRESETYEHIYTSMSKERDAYKGWGPIGRARERESERERERERARERARERERERERARERK